MNTLFKLGWAVAVVAILALAFQWRESRASNAHAEGFRLGALEMTRLCLEGEARHAGWLAKGLIALQAGQRDEGYKALDTLLESLLQSSEGLEDPPHPELLADAKRYLESSADPWER